ncbi:hypothetical protein WR25_18225 [Diploscapter pachys]|uniref:Peptidase A1 domain-containing protein n=1 Tax=Diploscapter pachys TaxID=2018661 RepID=A0A2A2LEA2_9BILA|nr:hypothetical protein WR25_18225 [Diploscapter pachys]
MQNVLSQLDQPLFTVWLDRKLDIPMVEIAGLITYGALDSVNCDSTVNYVPLSSETYWQFSIQAFSIGSITDSRTQQAISDTGTSWIGMSTSDLSGVISQTGAGYYIGADYDFYYVPCSKMYSLPDLQFRINNINYNISSVEYVLDLGLNDGNCAITFFAMDFGGFGQ